MHPEVRGVLCAHTGADRLAGRPVHETVPRQEWLMSAMEENRERLCLLSSNVILLPNELRTVSIPLRQCDPPRAPSLRKFFGHMVGGILRVNKESIR